MKKFWTLLSVLMLVVISCNKETSKDTSGSIEFSLGSSNSQLKSASVDSLATASAVVVTIEDANGKVIYNNEKIDLYNMDGSYISKPLSLVTGKFKLTKFMVVDKNSNVLYLTPVSGSAKAYLVKNPLAVSFTVSKDQVTKLTPEVVSAKGALPEDFGYATFNFNVVKTFNFLMGVFVYNSTSQNFELTSATVTVSSDSSLSFIKTIKAVTDTFTVKDGLSRYILKVSKDGYQTWSDTLSASELKLYYSSSDKGPLKVILEKSSSNNGLLAYYKFNQDVKDYSGNNNNGTYYGRKYFSFGHSQDTLSALDLNGSSDYVVVKNSASLKITKQLTLCAWYYGVPFSGNGANPLVGKYQLNTSSCNYMLYVTGSNYSTAHNNYGFTIKTDAQEYSINTYGPSLGFNYVRFLYDLYQWNFVVGTYDGSSLKLYVNGELKAWRSATGNILSSDDDVYVGKTGYLNRAAYDFLAGRIDEVRIYSRALSQDEIVQLYKQQ